MQYYTEPMVRHEAAEALAAIGDPNDQYGVEQILSRYVDDPVKEVAQTCQLALQMIRWKRTNDVASKSSQSIYNSIGKSIPTDLIKINYPCTFLKIRLPQQRKI